MEQQLHAMPVASAGRTQPSVAVTRQSGTIMVIRTERGNGKEGGVK